MTMIDVVQVVVGFSFGMVAGLCIAERFWKMVATWAGTAIGNGMADGWEEMERDS